MNHSGRLHYIHFLLEQHQWEAAQDLLIQHSLPPELQAGAIVFVEAFQAYQNQPLSASALVEPVQQLTDALKKWLQSEPIDALDEGRIYLTPDQMKELRNCIHHSKAHPKDREKALYALDLWAQTPQFAGHRAWGLIPGNGIRSESVHFRFWGLYNLRTQAEKPVWLSWDALDERMVVVKELRPGLQDPDKSNRINWESEIFNDFRDLQDRKVQGVVPLIAHGRNWFAAAHAQLGSLQWCFFVPPYRDEPGNEQLFHFIYPDNPFEGPITNRNWKKIRNYFITSARTLHNFHLQGIVHRDIHADNLLINQLKDEKEIEAWICDFDRARNYQDIFLPRHLNLPAEGPYTPPERMEKPLNSSSSLKQSAYYGLPEGDMYSLAAVLCDILLQKQHANPQDRYTSLQKNRQPLVHCGSCC